MATRKTTAEQIAATQAKIDQYENKMKLLMQKQKEKDDKTRTHRLIERGAILESLVPDATSATNEQIKIFLDKTVKTEYARRVWRELVPPPAIQPALEAAPNPAETPRSGGADIAQTTANSTWTVG